MKPQKGRHGSRPGTDLAERAMAEYLEHERRRYHEQLRGVRARSVEEVLEEAEPRFRQKGWRITGKGR